MSVDITKSVAFGIFAPNRTRAEETTCAFTSHPNAKNVASFGVFDGHNGSYASRYCAKELHKRTVTTLVTLRDTIENMKSDPDSPLQYLELNSLTAEDVHDAILCESLRRSSLSVDQHVRASDQNAGTTALSLFLHKNADRSIRAVCANIGDSRCVMYGSTLESVNYLPYNQPSRQSSVLKGLPQHIKSYQLSEDHKLALLRERSRVLGKLRLDTEKSWMVRPVTVFVSLPAAIVAYQNINHASVAPTFELGYPTKDRISTADALLEALVNTNSLPHAASESSNLSAHNSVSALRPVELNGTDDEMSYKSESDDRVRMPRRDTFIENDLVLVGRHGVKLRTTRSIGDKLGPRGLVAIPEMSAVTIMPTESARFVLASAALWEQLSEKVIINAVSGHMSPRDAAQALGRAAMETAGDTGGSKDVFVIVVDVNPHFIRRDVQGHRLEAECGCAIA